MAVEFDVSVVGLGALGSSIANALAASGYRVMVWNRSPARAAALGDAVEVATDPATAIASSPITLMCVLDYPAANDVLRQPGVEKALAGRTLVQLSGGVPELVADQHTWVHGCGGQFMSGAVMVFARNIGRPDALVVYSGDPCLDQHRALLTTIGGAPHYLGADPASAVAAFSTLSTYLFGALSAYLESAAIARYHGIKIDDYCTLAGLMTDEIANSIAVASDRVSRGDFVNRDGSIDTVVQGVSNACESYRTIGIPSRQTMACLDLLRRASERGFGELDPSYVVEMLWRERRGGGSEPSERQSRLTADGPTDRRR